MESGRVAAYTSRLAANWDARFGNRRVARLHGSLASIDLSGFTRLSERLALKSETGAEVLNATINAEFEPLIAIAHRLGGDILQFGGDALLIWFEGERHAERAAAATWAMQRHIIGHGRVETPAGPVRLRMSVGIATGEITFAVLGRTHRELIDIGVTASRTVALESLAAAGQVLVSPETAALLPPGSVTMHSDGAFKLRRAVDAPDSPVARADGRAAARFVPPEMRAIVAADVVTAEHRVVTVAFVMVPGTDALAAVGDDDAMLGSLDRIAVVADEAVERFGVCWSATDIGGDSFKLLFFAGAPRAQEDDAGRVLRTARLFVDRLPDAGLRIGVNRGLAFAADVGHPDRRTFAIIGDTTNLAARLMGKSAPGRPLTVDAVIAGSRAAWSCGAPSTISVKGKRLPIRAIELLGESDAAFDRSVGDVVGRAGELAGLRSLLPSAGAAGTSVSVIGDAGIGKTAIVDDLVRTSGDRRVLRAVATAFRQRDSHGALAPCFPSLATGSDGDDALFDAGDLVARRDRRHAALVDELLREREPTVLVVEDAQWLDEASRAFLGQLLAATDRLPWLVVVSGRPDGERLPTAHTIELAGMALDELLRMSSPAEGSGWLDRDLTALHAAVGGNPMLFREGLLLPPGASVSVVAGRGNELLAQRLDQLDPTSRRMVRTLAVAGRPLPTELLGVVAEHDLPRSPARAFRGVLVEQPEGWWFAHEPLRAVAYAGLARRDRIRVHALTARELELRRGDLGVSAAELAAHHFHGEATDPAFRWCVAAADEARDSGSLRDAALHLERAVRVAPAVLDRPGAADLVLQLGELEIALGRFTEADTLLRRAWDQLGIRPPARALVLRARAAEQAGRFVAARRLLGRAASDPLAEPADRVDVDLLDGLVSHRVGRQQRSVAESWRGLLAAKRLPDDRRRAQGHLQLELVRWLGGHPDVARHQAVAEALFRRAGDRKGLGYLLMNRGVNRLNEGPWDLALRDCEEAASVLDDAGYLIDGALAAMNGLVILVRRGLGAQAEPKAERIGRTFTGLGWPEGLAYLRLPLAAAAGQRGELDRALDLLARSEEVFVATHNSEFLGEVRRQRALCLLYGGRAEQARAALATIDPAWFELDPVLAVGADWLSGHAALVLGELDAAGRQLRAAVELAGSRTLPYEQARAAWSLESWATRVGVDPRPWVELRTRIFAELGVTNALPPLPS